MELQANTGNHERGVFAWGGKACEKGANRSEALLSPDKTGGDWKKDLQTCEAGRKSRKRPTPVVGKKPNGKCQINSLWAMDAEYLALIADALGKPDDAALLL
jgi:hypothetical protein